MKVKIVNSHRKEMINHLSNYIQKNEMVDDIIIVGDWNQNINSEKIQDFYIKHGLFDVHSYINNANDTQREPTY